MAKQKESVVFEAFADCNSIPQVKAKEDGLPIELVAARTGGSLIFATREMYTLVVRFEEIYSHLLTAVNLLAFGDSFLAKVDAVAATDSTVVSRFDDACFLMFERLAGDGIIKWDSKPILQRVLQLWYRLRAKDYVNTLMGQVKKNPNSTRTAVAASIEFAAAKNASYRARIASGIADEEDEEDEEDGSAVAVALGSDEQQGTSNSSKRPKTTSGCMACDVEDRLSAVVIDASLHTCKKNASASTSGVV